MDPVQVIFPPDWDKSIETRIAERGRTTAADYIRDLVAADIQPQYLDEETERLIEVGLDSPIAGPADEAFWAERHRKLAESLRAKTP